MDMRVFWAVLAALGVAGVAVLGCQRYREYQAALVLQEVLNSWQRFLLRCNARPQLQPRNNGAFKRRRKLKARWRACLQRMSGASAALLFASTAQRIYKR